MRRWPPLLIVVLGLVVVLLVLCGCLVGIGGGATLSAYLSPTLTPIPTATTANTPAPEPTATPVPIPTRTPLPTPTRSASVEPMRTYSSAGLGFSIQYPVDWNVQEDTTGITFSSPQGSAIVAIAVIQNPMGSEMAFRDQSVQNFARSLTNMEIVSEDTRTFNGLTWQYVIITGSLQNDVPVTIDHYTMIHTDGMGYIFSGITITDNYDRATQTFTQMMESLRFLP